MIFQLNGKSTIQELLDTQHKGMIEKIFVGKEYGGTYGVMIQNQSSGSVFVNINVEGGAGSGYLIEPMGNIAFYDRNLNNVRVEGTGQIAILFN